MFNRQLLLLSLPIVLSNGIQTLLLLIDRHLLSIKDPLLSTVATMAGFTALSVGSFFIYFLSFSTSLIGKRFGQGDMAACRSVLVQSSLLSVAFSVVLFLLSFGGEPYFRLLKHPQPFCDLENGYFKWILVGTIPLLFKTSIASYLIGVGRGTPILIADLIGLFVNTFLCHLFVLGPYSHLFAGATGAAAATIITNSLTALFLSVQVPWTALRAPFWQDYGLFLTQGAYTGLEKFTNSFFFVLFVNMFVVYGPEVSAAVSIVFTYDQIAFLPLSGIYISLMSLYSCYLGKKEPAEADRLLHSTLRTTLLLMALFSLFFLTCSDWLIERFLQTKNGQMDLPLVRSLGSKLFQTTCIYIFIQALIFIYKAALRSLGLSSWCFRASLLIHLALILSSYICVYLLHTEPFLIWSYYMVMLGALALVFGRKFYAIHKRPEDLVF